MLRNPVERFVSNFYSVKQSKHWAGSRMIGQNLSQFLQDPDSMMEARGIWHDGQVS